MKIKQMLLFLQILLITKFKIMSQNIIIIYLLLK